MKNIYIKICGIKNEEEVALINEFDVSFAGFIFAPSKRQVTVEKCKVLRGLLREDIEPVGVFVDESPEVINEIINTCHLAIVQLHGKESLEIIRKIRGAKVWKCIGVSELTSIESEMEPYLQGVKEGIIHGFLLDTSTGGKSGGTGKTFDWELIPDSSYRGDADLIIAGGLNGDNIEEAYKKTKSVLYDVNSGVETEGLKDRNKIVALFDKINQIEIEAMIEN